MQEEQLDFVFDGLLRVGGMEEDCIFGLLEFYYIQDKLFFNILYIL